jgi:S-formylglutathione hydrolase FrmB
MALIHCDFFSDSLGLCSSMTVILPQNTRSQIGMTGKAGDKKHPVLYLLHGMSDDHTIWLRRTSIERYVSDLGIAVVMPAVARSYYTDMHTGLKYWTFVSEELPRLAESFFGATGFVGGLFIEQKPD